VLNEKNMITTLSFVLLPRTVNIPKCDDAIMIISDDYALFIGVVFIKSCREFAFIIF